MGKKLLCILVTVLLSFSLLPSTFFAQEVYEVFPEKYNIYKDGNLLPLRLPVLNYNGAVYLSASEISKVFGANATRSKKGSPWRIDFTSSPVAPNNPSPANPISVAAKPNIVMLGDSITNGGQWNTSVGNNNVLFINLGVRGETTEKMVQRLFNVYDVKPNYVFVLAGINDFFAGNSTETTFNTYKEMVRQLQGNGVIPIIQSTLYVNRDNINDKNTQVTELNRLLKAYAEENKIHYMDLNAVLSVQEKLNKDYSSDGVHLNSRGYSLWSKEVQKELAVLGY